MPEAPALKSARQKAQEERRAQRAAANAKGKYAVQQPVGSSIQYGGPEDAWTKLAHALFQANEAMFIN